MDKRQEQIPHTGRYRDGKQAYGKMLHIIYHQGTANKKKQAATTTSLSEWPDFKGLTTPNAGKDVNRQELSFLGGGGDAKGQSDFGRQFASFLVNYTYSTLLVGI